MSRSLLLLPLLLTACPPAEDKGPAAEPACTVEITETIPATGGQAYYRADVEFHLSDPDPTATITCDMGGTATVSEDGETLYWELSAPMAAGAHSCSITTCKGESTIDFTTSELGGAVDSATLLDRTYSLALGDARIVEPAGIGDVLGSYLTQDILVGVQSIEGTDIQMIGAIGREDSNPPVQETCDPTIPFPLADFSETPYFQIGPQTTTLNVASYSIEIGNLEITGTFSPDGSYFGGGTLAGTIDTRPLAPLLDDSEDADEGAICDLAINFGAACTACPEDGEPFCLTLVADQIVATEVSGLTLLEVGGNNCLGCQSATEATDLSATCEIDDDEDGYGVTTDCNDDESGVHPNAEEVAGDGVDSNCNDVEDS